MLVFYGTVPIGQDKRGPSHVAWGERARPESDRDTLVDQINHNQTSAARSLSEQAIAGEKLAFFATMKDLEFNRPSGLGFSSGSCL